MAERAVSLECGGKDEKVAYINTKIKVGLTGKAKLSNMRRLLARNSEELKHKILEYFGMQRMMLYERERRLLDKVNVLVDCRITEIDERLKHFQEKLIYLNAYQQNCLGNGEPVLDDCCMTNEFDHFVAAPIYDFYVDKDGLQSSFKKLGRLEQVDMLISSLDSSSSDNDDNDSTCLHLDNAYLHVLMKKLSMQGKESSIRDLEMAKNCDEVSDAASSCSILSCKGLEEENEHQVITNNGSEDDYEFLTLGNPFVQFPVNLSLRDYEDTKEPSAFDQHVAIEKTLDILKDGKVNETNILQEGSPQCSNQDTTEKMDTAAAENEESNIPNKSIELTYSCQRENKQNESNAKAFPNFQNFLNLHFKSIMCSSSQESFKENKSIDVEAVKGIDHISSFNSRVEMILGKSASKGQKGLS